MAKTTTHRFNNHFEVTVTDNPAVVDSWVSDIISIEPSSTDWSYSLVGLNTKWRPKMEHKASLLQLFTRHKYCLILRLHNLNEIPRSLRDFLQYNRTFVGLDIARDVEKLRKEYGLRFNNVFDVRELAIQCWTHQFYTKPTLKDIAYVAGGINIPKLENNDWESEVLDEEQVKFAMYEAYASYRIRIILSEKGITRERRCKCG